MNTWRLMVGFLALGAVATACSVKTTKGDDDDAGAGGTTTSTTTGTNTTTGSPTTTTGTNTTTGSPTTTTTSTQSTSSGVMCDTGAAGDLGDATCDTCQSCAAQGACAGAISTCQNSQSCQGFLTCWDACIAECDANTNDAIDPDEEACFDPCFGDEANPQAGTCVGDNAQGVDEYLAILSCLICEQCPNNCNAAEYCTSG